MSRQRSPRPLSAAEITAEICDEQSQVSLLRADLSDALLAGESTVSYRQAIAQIEQKIASLSRQLADIAATDAEIRHQAALAAARDTVAESKNRHAALIAAFAAPPPPKAFAEFSK